MAFDITTTLTTIRDYIIDNSRADHAVIGTRYILPTENTFAAVSMDSVSVAETTLGTTIEQHVVNIRYYQRALGPDPDVVELNLATKVELILSDLIGEFDLGGTIRSVDVGGIYGVTPGATFEHDDDDRYRIANITIPLIVDDSITTTP